MLYKGWSPRDDAKLEARRCIPRILFIFDDIKIVNRASVFQFTSTVSVLVSFSSSTNRKVSNDGEHKRNIHTYTYKKEKDRRIIR